jgi:shikimate kinase/3-dehydroquinate synthase
MSHIFLYGPPGSGKSTVGKVLAERLRLPFVDLDQAIESKTGMSIARILEERGEDVFRDLESSTLRDLTDEQESVAALGGGTLLQEKNRAFVEKHGKIICLRAKLQILFARLQSDLNPRPLLAGDLRERLASLLARRDGHYNSFLLQVNADCPPVQLAWHIQTVLGHFHLSVMGDYDVIVQSGSADQVGSLLRAREVLRPLIVTDENISKLYSERVLDSLRHSNYDAGLLTIPAGESHKSLDTVNKLWHGFLEAGLDRKSTVIALGGGVVGDLAGFAASTFMRGIDWVSLPTTLLSMVDASLGGKTGFDLPEGKNLIGSFHPPRLVLADPEMLNSLPEAEFRAGLAEVVKHGVIADPELFEVCARGHDAIKNNLNEVIGRAMAVKVKIIEADPYERGERASLNLGHTIGHAVELVSGFCIRHGEAVAMGMVAEAKLAERLAVAHRGVSERIAKTLSTLSLPIHIPKHLPREKLIHALRADKKKSKGVVRFALPVEIGRVQVNVEVQELGLAFEEK